MGYNASFLEYKVVKCPYSAFWQNLSTCFNGIVIEIQRSMSATNGAEDVTKEACKGCH